MKIVFLDAKTLGDSDLSIFEKFGEFIIYPTTQPQKVIQRIQDVDIVITNKVILNEEILRNSPKLKLICIAATGTNNIDMDVAKELGIEVKNVAGYSTKSVAQHTITMALNLLSKIHYYDNYCKSSQWSKSDTFNHLNGGLSDLDNKEWGIIGLGNIGKRVASLAQAFGAKISYTSMSGQNTNQDYPQKTLKNLLKESDIISIHSPLNEKTKNLINQKELLLLKEGAVLINVGRGGIVNEYDLAATLKTKNFYFGADVLEIEPMKAKHPFLDPQIQHKLILTPHIAWAYGESIEKLIKSVAENIQNFIEKN